jgi:hypothetical protein
MQKCCHAGSVSLPQRFCCWPPGAQAQETAKGAAATQGARPATDQKKKAVTVKKKAAQPGGCAVNGRKWASGKSCMTTCNEKQTLCDMRICAKGEWKNYGSCFGQGAVAKNCPPSCE